jgi:hypothetical protein
MVLLKGYDERGFIFYTNYSSRKGRELTQGGKASFCVFWEGLQRQVGGRGGGWLGSVTVCVQAGGGEGGGGMGMMVRVPPQRSATAGWQTRHLLCQGQPLGLSGGKPNLQHVRPVCARCAASGARGGAGGAAAGGRVHPLLPQQAARLPGGASGQGGPLLLLLLHLAGGQLPSSCSCPPTLHSSVPDKMRCTR